MAKKQLENQMSLFDFMVEDTVAAEPEVAAAEPEIDNSAGNNTNHTKVKVITSNHEIASVEDSGAIRCDRVWAYLEYGGQYYLPKFNNLDFADLWLCQVTLFVIGWWPKYIYVIDESDN